jgi:hypothetical protein
MEEVDEVASPSGLPKFTSPFVPPSKIVTITNESEAESTTKRSLEMMCKHMLELMNMEIWSHRKFQEIYIFPPMMVVCVQRLVGGQR